MRLLRRILDLACGLASIIDAGRTIHFLAYADGDDRLYGSELRRFDRLDDFLDAFDAGCLRLDESPSTGTTPAFMVGPWGAQRLWMREVQALSARRKAGR